MSLAWTFPEPSQVQVRQKFENFWSELEFFENPKSTKFVDLSGQKHFLRLIGPRPGRSKIAIFHG